MKRSQIAATVALAVIVAAGSARADVTFIRGATTPAAEGILFNQAGLIQTCRTVQGRTELTQRVFNFTFLQGIGPLTTTSPGEPRVDAPGFRFNSLGFSFDDPEVSFTELDFTVNADQVGLITFGALTTDGGVHSSTSTLDSTLNPFSVVATSGLRLREITYVSPAPYTVDVRRIRIGGVDVVPAPIPEPGTWALLALGLLPLVVKESRKRRRRVP